LADYHGLFIKRRIQSVLKLPFVGVDSPGQNHIGQPMYSKVHLYNLRALRLICSRHKAPGAPGVDCTISPEQRYRTQMYEINDSYAFIFPEVIIRRPIREHLAPIGYQLQPLIRTSNTDNPDSRE